MIITPIWANMGVDGLAETEKVDNCRIDTIIRKSVRDFTANSIRSNLLIFDYFAIIDPSVDAATAAPMFHMHKFVKTCQKSAGFLP